MANTAGPTKEAGEVPGPGSCPGHARPSTPGAPGSKSLTWDAPKPLEGPGAPPRALEGPGAPRKPLEGPGAPEPLEGPPKPLEGPGAPARGPEFLMFKKFGPEIIGFGGV